MLGSDKGMLMDALGALTRTQAEQHGGTPTLQVYNGGTAQIITTIKQTNTASNTSHSIFLKVIIIIITYLPWTIVK